jgi:hypothetical protein
VTAESNVEAGQVWTDPKNPTRRLLVTGTNSRWATCKSSHTDRPGRVRTTNIELWTFRRYELLPDSEEGA